MDSFFSQPIIEIMAAPCVACLILACIHSYLGLHIIERGVIFVDLALAQTAAFGATVALLFGYNLHTSGNYLWSLMFALIAAFLFAISRTENPRVPHEAVIGIVYAVAGGAAILALSRAPEGGEELKALLVGHLLFVSWDEVVKLLIIYGVVGCLHWFFRRPFLTISCSPNTAYAKGMNIRTWDFIFYGLFGVVVTSSVELAGVLLVFCFLIVPAVCGKLVADSLIARLGFGWIFSFVVCIVGIAASYVWDFPTGAMVVTTFGGAAGLVGIWSLLNPRPAVGQVSSM